MTHLIETVRVMEERCVGFHSLTESIDTTTPGGRLVFHLFGALGQFERNRIRGRPRAGLESATVRERRGWRKPMVAADKVHRALDLVTCRLTVRQTATRLKVGKMALYAELQVQAAHATQGHSIKV